MGAHRFIFSLDKECARYTANLVPKNAGSRWLYVLFFVSGFPALLYQIVWQRARFAIYGVNIESVTGVTLCIGLMASCMETAESIRRRCRASRIITDDNMASEWTR